MRRDPSSRTRSAGQGLVRARTWGFISSVTAFANEFDWKTCPLAHRLADAVILAVEDEVKLRMAEESMHPMQLSLFQEDSS